MTRTMCFLGLALALAAVGSVGWAQDLGSVRGVVVDDKGQPVRGATVSAFSDDIMRSVSVFSKADGSFEINGLEPRSYRIRGRLIGLEDTFIENVNVKLGQPGDVLKLTMKPASNLDLQRPADSLLSLMKWDNEDDKTNFKMMCAYCHQVGTIGFRTPEEPVDWETMVTRMDGFGGLYKHTQETLVQRLLETYTAEAMEKWPAYTPPPAPDGKALLATITEWDLGKQDATMIHDLELGSDGLVYTVDMTNDAVITLDPKTGKREVYTVPGGKEFDSDSSPIKGPHSIERDHDGNMWITLALSGQMAKFDVKTKEWLQVSGFPGRPRGAYPHTLRVDAKGRVWYTDAGMGVFMLDPNNNNEIKYYRLPANDQAVGAGRGESRGVTPYGISISPVDGTVWYTKLNGNRLGRINPDTDEIKEWNPPFRGPRRHEVAADGIVWVPGFGSGVLGKFDPKTEEWEVIELPDHLNQIPYALSVHPETGDIWICGTGQDTMLRYVPSTKELITYRMPSRVTYTREVEFGEDGSIWVCNSNYPVRHTERGYGSVIKIALDTE